MLEVKDIDVFYGASQALYGMSMTVGEGEVVTLMGRNGMGKTTTVHAIMAIVPLSGGAITLAEMRLDGLPSHRIAQAGPNPPVAVPLREQALESCPYIEPEQVKDPCSSHGDDMGGLKSGSCVDDLPPEPGKSHLEGSVSGDVGPICLPIHELKSLVEGQRQVEPFPICALPHCVGIRSLHDHRFRHGFCYGFCHWTRDCE